MEPLILFSPIIRAATFSAYTERKKFGNNTLCGDAIPVVQIFGQNSHFTRGMGGGGGEEGTLFQERRRGGAHPSGRDSQESAQFVERDVDVELAGGENVVLYHSSVQDAGAWV